MTAERGDQAGTLRADQITLDEIVVRKGGLPPPPAPPLVIIGWRAFLVLVAFIGVSYVVMAVFAWSIYPQLSTFGIEVNAPGLCAPGTVARWQDTHEQWLATIKELGQLFIVTPLLPLLGAVLGYVFGRERRDPSQE
jgi:hypothetical protein